MKIIIQGQPVPKGRPRARIVKPYGKEPFISFYTPKETQDYEDAIGWAAKGAMQGKPPLNCACEIEVKAFMRIPTSWNKKMTSDAMQGILRPITRTGDADNFIKCAADGLNGIAFTDDSLCVKMSCEKFYSENPRLEIEVKEYVPTNL